MNFNIIENGESAWDKTGEIIQLYNQGLPVQEIRAELGISSPSFNKVIKELKQEGKIRPRRRPYKKRAKKKKKPKYYYRSSNRPGFNIVKNKRFYGYVRTAKEAELFVYLMAEYDWDYSKRYIVKQKVKEVLQNGN